MVNYRASIFVVFLVFSSLSCDLFRTRTPEEPTGASSDFISPANENELLDNMKSSFESRNIVNYLKSFSGEDFIFSPSSNSENRYGGVLKGWEISKERDYFNNLVNRYSTSSRISLIFYDQQITRSGDNNSEVSVNYTLELLMQGISKKFQGAAQFECVRNQFSYWVIQKWSDYGNDSTWSDLKGIAYNQLWQ